ncbi:hypothetical protein FJZ36_15920 [Candidatus Poribacteria bacterium]|nr:hypothetical protein [Candidatus Poribacteria bacterium]
MATTVEQVLRQIETLTDEERRRVRDALDKLVAAEPQPTPAQRRMLEAGLIRNVADPRKRAAFFRNHRPIKLEGEIISERILAERR